MFRKEFLSLLLLAVTVTVVVVVLKMLNWLPTVVQEGAMKRYGSIEEIRSRLKIEEIYVPSYFPYNFTWPPVEMLAQSKPFHAIIMSFTRKEKGDVGLVITQAASKEFIYDKKIKMAQINEKMTYSIKGRKAHIEVGRCSGNESCSQLMLDEGGYRIRIIMKSRPFDMIKVAESMFSVRNAISPDR